MAIQKNIQAPFACAKSWKDRAVHALVTRSWWMFLFMISCFMVYSHAMHKKQAVCEELEEHLKALQHQKELLNQTHENLIVQINSQSDPAWIQLSLMKGLGVVPEGQQKVYFHGTKE